MIDQVRTNGFEMAYLRFGTGEKTLVILPGLSVQSVLNAAPAIEKQYEIFRDDFTVFLFDRRKELPENYSVEDMARDTAQVLKALGLSRLYLFGASQGGMIAQLLASLPDLAEKAVFASSACRVDEKRFGVIRDWIALAEEKRAADLFLSFGEKVYPPATFARYKNALVTLSKSVTEEELARFAILAKGAEGFDGTECLRPLRLPVLATGDKTDAVLGADATLEIGKAMGDNPRFQLYLSDGFGHAAYDTAPDYTRRLFDFFSR